MQRYLDSVPQARPEKHVVQAADTICSEDKVGTTKELGDLVRKYVPLKTFIRHMHKPKALRVSKLNFLTAVEGGDGSVVEEALA